MSLTFVYGRSLFDEEADILVNTVNCVGVMGKGVALAFKTRYPNMFEEYRQLCDEGSIRIGSVHVYEDILGETIVNLPTKLHWRNPSRYEYVEAGLIAFRSFLSERDQQHVHIPALGCGSGGLIWSQVQNMIRSILDGLDHDIRVFEPQALGDIGYDHHV